MACHFLLLKLDCKSGFSRAVTAQIKKLHSPPSSSLKAMGRFKLPPAGCQLIPGLIPVMLGISTLVSEERQVHGVRQELTRAVQGK